MSEALLKEVARASNQLYVHTVEVEELTARRSAVIVQALQAGAGSHAVALAAGLSPARIRAIARAAGLTGQTWTTKGDTP